MALLNRLSEKFKSTAGAVDAVEARPNWIKRVAWLVAGLLVLSYANPFATVPTGYRGVVTTFGKVDPSELPEGLHLVRPFIDKVRHVNVQVQKIETRADAGTRDLQRVDTTIAVNGHIDPSQAAWVLQNVGTAEALASRVVSPAVEEVAKAVTAKYSAEQLLAERQKVSLEIRTALSERLRKYGVIVDDFSITNFQFSPTYQKSIDEKVVVEQQKLTAERERDKAKIEAEKAVAVAEGEKQSKIKRAEAEAESIRIQREALKSSPEILELRKIEAQMAWIQKWDGKQPHISAGSNAGLMFQVPASR
jgi:prohibitin 2